MGKKNYKRGHKEPKNYKRGHGPRPGNDYYDEDDDYDDDDDYYEFSGPGGAGSGPTCSCPKCMRGSQGEDRGFFYSIFVMISAVMVVAMKTFELTRATIFAFTPSNGQKEEEERECAPHLDPHRPGTRHMRRICFVNSTCNYGRGQSGHHLWHNKIRR